MLMQSTGTDVQGLYLGRTSGFFAINMEDFCPRGAWWFPGWMPNESWQTLITASRFKWLHIGCTLKEVWRGIPASSWILAGPQWNAAPQFASTVIFFPTCLKKHPGFISTSNGPLSFQIKHVSKYCLLYCRLHQSPPRSRCFCLVVLLVTFWLLWWVTW